MCACMCVLTCVYLIVCVHACSLSDHELVWKYIDWVLEKDEEMGVKVSATLLFLHLLP